MSVEENIALMRRWFKEVWNEGRIQTVYDLMSENAIGIGQDRPGVEIHGPAEFVALVSRHKNYDRRRVRRGRQSYSPLVRRNDSYRRSTRYAGDEQKSSDHRHLSRADRER